MYPKQLYTISIFVFSSLLFFSGFAQSPGIEWQKAIGGNSRVDWRFTIPTSDSNLLETGTLYSQSIDISVSKVAQDGRLLWTKTFGGSGSDYLYGVFNAADGGYILVASTNSPDGDVVGFHPNPSPYNTDVWVVKLSSSGSIEWQRCIGGTLEDQFIQGIVQPDGSFILAGDTDSKDGDFSNSHGGNFYDVFVMKLNNQGNTVWQRLIGGTRADEFRQMLIKPNGNFLILGDGDSSDGDMPPNKGNTDIFMAELDTTGKLLWTHKYGGSSDELASRMIPAGTGKYAVVCTTSSNDGDVSGLHGADDYWLFTVDESGNLLWKKTLGGSEDESYPSIGFDAADNSIIIAGTSESKNGDMSTNHGYADIWMAKISNTGSLVWEKCIGGKYADAYNGFTVNENGEIFLMGLCRSNDGDISGNHGGEDLWFAKLTGAGAIEWQRSLGGSSDESYGSFFKDGNTFTILAPTTSGDGDVQGMHGLTDIWLLNISSNGTLNWQKTLGGSNQEALGNVLKINGKYFISGQTDSHDGDVSGYTGNRDIWVVKLGSSDIIKGTVFVDLNSNGVKDNNEPFYDNVIVKSEKSNYVRWSIPYNGQFKNEVDTGNINTTVVPSVPYFKVVPVVKQSVFSNYFLIDSVDFALQPIPGTKDVTTNIIPLTPARSGLNSSYRIYYKNIGTDTIASGNVYMVKDSRTSFVNAAPSPDVISGDTLTWNYSNLKPYDSASVTVTLQIAAPPAVNLGDTLLQQVFIDPVTNDETPVNNRDTLKQIVRSAYDPNDKSESHAGQLSLTGVKGADYLTYMINFQNVGNDTAFTVVVRDTLDEKLDWSNLQMIGASHAWSLQVTDGNKCQWTFNDINLPYSSINEPASHGYIAFRIKAKSTLSIGDIIANTASVYFTNNLPVVTNTVTTVVTSELIATPVISGLTKNYCAGQGAQNVKIIDWPDNSTSVEVKLDNTVLPVTDSSFSINVSALTPGTHIVYVSYTNFAGTKTIRANFTVTEIATPDVNVTADITRFTTLTNPVTITANNAAGGGKMPLYTFAWDKNFTNIIQTESNNNIVTIAASAFAIGDNTIYVKMKTSESCYTILSNTDSITIRRDQSTGIIDPEYPGSVIAVYPNPFTGPVTVSGLNTGKTYVISILNVNAQVVFTKRVTNQTTINIDRFKNATGVYWMNIYDEKKKRLLGSVKLLKQ